MLRIQIQNRCMNQISILYTNLGLCTLLIENNENRCRFCLIIFSAIYIMLVFLKTIVNRLIFNIPDTDSFLIKRKDSQVIF